jgi:hypothetical protein
MYQLLGSILSNLGYSTAPTLRRKGNITTIGPRSATALAQKPQLSWVSGTIPAFCASHFPITISWQDQGLGVAVLKSNGKCDLSSSSLLTCPLSFHLLILSLNPGWSLSHKEIHSSGLISVAGLGTELRPKVNSGYSGAKAVLSLEIPWVHLPSMSWNYPVTFRALTPSAKGPWSICKEAVNVKIWGKSAGPGGY